MADAFEGDGVFDDLEQTIEVEKAAASKWSPQRRLSRAPASSKKRRSGDEFVHPINKNLLNPLNFYSFLSFSWLNPVLSIGWKRKLVEKDLIPLPHQFAARVVADRVEKNWLAMKDRKGFWGSLPWAYFYTFKAPLIAISLCVLIETAAQIAQPVFLGEILDILQNDEMNTRKTEAYLWGLGIVLLAIFASVFHHVVFMYSWSLGMQMKQASIGLVYRKILHVSKETLAGTSTGQIITMTATDFERMVNVCVTCHYLWVGPVNLIVVVWLIWLQIGPSSLAGISLLILTIPLHMWNSKNYAKFRRQTANTTDERVKLVSEAVSGMRVVKMYAWEQPWAKWISDLRQKELSFIKKTTLIRALNIGFNFASNQLLGFFCFLTYELTGGNLTAQKAFTVLTLISTVKLTMTFIFPSAMITFSELRVAFSRFEAFMRLPDIPDGSLNGGHAVNGSSGFLEVDGLECAWKSNTVLRGVSFSLHPGELLTVVGPVGAGKSTLLLALLGEMLPTKGTIRHDGDVGYAPQEPWIVSDSVRENILFGKPFEEDWYATVVEACQLVDDIARMPDKDSTQIGERGVTLSGGQKARLGLARTVYARPAILLLDDPLSAVDVKVGKKLFELCLRGVLRRSMVVLVTHQVQFVSFADKVLVLSAGGVASPVSVPSEGVLREISHQISETADEEDLPETSPKDEDPAKEAKKLVGEEDKFAGNLSTETLLSYLKAGALEKKWLLSVAFFVVILAQAAAMGSDYFLSYWVQKPESERESYSLGLYSGLIAFFTIVAFFRALMLAKGTINASRLLHNSALQAVMSSPMRFFDTQPVGRILNRFSSDLGLIDDLLPVALIDFTQLMFLMIGIIIFVSSLNPFIFLLSVPLVVLFYFLRKYYMATAREVKRIESANRSPIYSQISATLTGLATIRCLGAADNFQKNMESHQNAHSRAFFAFVSLARWLAFRLDLMTFLFVSMTIFVGLALSDSLGAGKVGLSILYALQLTLMFQWCVRQSAEVENHLVSVERLLTYSKLQSEEDFLVRPLTISHDDLGDWPSNGGVKFSDVRLQYAYDEPFVLNHLNLSILPTWKTGIVGRTGAGKSSILAALFNLSPLQGSVSIDGVDSQTLSLQDWRCKISVIPQDPVIFSGSLRMNLDPFDRSDPQLIWDALEAVCLKKVVESMPQGLETKMSEAGSNLSVGQRQLVCLARAILSTNKILVLDEATANVDNETDSIIQKTIRERFAHCTVLTIAHRLHTIMDCDRIIVMDAGRAVEFDSPNNLLKKKDGYFRSMVLENSLLQHRIQEVDAEELVESIKEGASSSNDSLHLGQHCSNGLLQKRVWELDI